MISGADRLLPSRPLGATRIQVTELGFGGASLGNLYRPVDEDQARAAVVTAWSAGMRYFDTAPYYGFGLSERRIGDALRDKRREYFVLSTKVGRLLRPMPSHHGDAERCGFRSPMPFEPVFDYSYDGILRSYESSLQRLGLSRVDVLLVHDIGPATHGKANDTHFKALMGGGYRALDELRSSGDIVAVGLGVNEWEICEAAMDYGRFDCVLLAGRYTLLEQEALQTFFPKCAVHGTTVIIGGAYNSGILATGVRRGGVVHYNYEPAPENVIERVGKIEEICDIHGVPLPAAALRFPLAHPQVSCVIPGMGSPRRIEQVTNHYSATIPDAFWRDMKGAGLIREDAPIPQSQDGVC